MNFTYLIEQKTIILKRNKATKPPNFGVKQTNFNALFGTLFVHLQQDFAFAFFKTIEKANAKAQ